MPIQFYPNQDDLESSSLMEKIEVLMEAAERYKAVILGAATDTTTGVRKLSTPRDIVAAYNWEEIAKLLHQIRDMPEATSANKITKAEHLTKLADIYEVLRGAKMPKLEAVRIALLNEANQLKSAASQVA